MFLMMIFCFLRFTLSSTKTEAAKWEVISHRPGGHFDDVFFLDEAHGWVVGTRSFLWTENSGKNWKKIPFEGDEQLFKVQFVTPKKGFLLRRTPDLLRVTGDRGKTWKEIAGQFYDFHFLNENEGWGFARPTAILYTKDGGKNWTHQKKFANLSHPHKLFFLNEKIGWAINNNQLWQTKNAGKTWTLLNDQIPAQGFYFDISFLNPDQGWSVSEGKIYQTSDGGVTWQEIHNQPNSTLTAISMKGDKGFVVGNSLPVGGLILKTVDGGNRWTLVMETNSSLYDITFQGKNGWAVGFDNTILHTTDEGESWLPQVEPSYTYSDLQLFKTGEGFLLANGISARSSLLVTTDGGKNFTTPTTLPHGYNQLQFLSPKQGWVAGRSLAETKDAGANFQELSVPGKIRSLFFLDAETGFVGADNHLFKTVDGGSTWERKLTADDSIGIYFADRQNGWASTFPVIWFPDTIGLIYATRDGGETWQVQHKGPIIYDFCFIDSNRGWAVGYDLSIRRGVILATKNGGRTWERQWEIRGSFLRVLFLSPKLGWTVGIRGIILHTQDGGKTWQVQESGVNVYLWGLAYNGKDAVVATGDWSTIVRYTDARLPALAVSSQEKQITTWARQKNAVFQNYPNPFNPETWFPFALNRRSNVEIQIYSANGDLVRTLRLGGKAPGIYRSKPQAAYWDGNNDAGEAVSSGVYFYQLRVGEATFVRKAMLLK